MGGAGPCLFAGLFFGAFLATLLSLVFFAAAFDVGFSLGVIGVREVFASWADVRAQAYFLRAFLDSLSAAEFV